MWPAARPLRTAQRNEFVRNVNAAYVQGLQAGAVDTAFVGIGLHAGDAAK